MGAECIISGIRPQIAQTIVHCLVLGGWKPSPSGEGFRRLAVGWGACAPAVEPPLPFMSCTPIAFSPPSTASRSYGGHRRGGPGLYPPDLSRQRHRDSGRPRASRPRPPAAECATASGSESGEAGHSGQDLARAGSSPLVPVNKSGSRRSAPAGLRGGGGRRHRELLQVPLSP